MTDYSLIFAITGGGLVGIWTYPIKTFAAKTAAIVVGDLIVLLLVRAIA